MESPYVGFKVVGLGLGDVILLLIDLPSLTRSSISRRRNEPPGMGVRFRIGGRDLKLPDDDVDLRVVGLGCSVLLVMTHPPLYVNTKSLISWFK